MSARNDLRKLEILRKAGNPCRRRESDTALPAALFDEIADLLAGALVLDYHEHPAGPANSSANSDENIAN